MLFNSYAFLFAFLPVALLGYQVAGHFHRRAVVAWLGFASLAFYAYWKPAFLLLLLASIGLNYLAAALISRAIPNEVPTRLWLWLAISLNLAALGYFKYLFPLLNFAGSLAGSSHHWTNVLLPLGISFFTFTQIAFLVDLQQGIAAHQDLASYVLFVTFFPHLIAGPILHHKDTMPQFQQDRAYRLRADDLATGLSWFVMGLAKKVILADTFARTANLGYNLHEPLAAVLAWRTVLSYALQLYFDFSGYSDMALGLARMFSIDFPLNFSSPYKATSIIDFWQRWHITLTQYITAYVYTPVSKAISSSRLERGQKVSRKAQATAEGFTQMIALPTVLTLAIAGVWHGAGLQYIVYGLLHGAYITANHAWRTFGPQARLQQMKAAGGRPAEAAMHVMAVLLTFLAVVVSQAFFRADNCAHALRLLAGMAGLHGAGPAFFAGEAHSFKSAAFAGLLPGFLIVWGLPNTQQILSRFRPGLALTPWDEGAVPRRLLWFPNLAWALGLSFLFFGSVLRLEDPSTFLYFQF